MKAKIRATAQKLLNLYRQEHAIVGGWSVVNKVLIDEADENVIAELRELPTGKTLIKHIENLRSGKTPMDSIERELLPYGGMMSEMAYAVALTSAQWQELENAINSFIPNQQGLQEFLSLDVVRSFGDQWKNTIKAALYEKKNLQDKWQLIEKTYNAYRLWNAANEIVDTPLSDRKRAEVQADMPEYETYLPMFGETGTELLEKLRNAISTM